MKILHTVESYLPSQHGMSEVVKQLSELLVKKGHEVVVAASVNSDRVSKVINGVIVEEFDIKGNMVFGMQGECEKYIQFLLNSDFDVITNFAAQQWATDLMLPILDKITAKKFFVPTGFSGLYRAEYRSYYENMKTWLLQYDRVVYLSDNYRDVNFARNYGIGNELLIPNGASKQEFLVESPFDIRSKLNIPSNKLLILHVSGYIGGKGHLDAIRIFRKAKLKNAVLLFISPDFNKFPRIGKDSIRTIVKFILLKLRSEMLPLYLIRFLQNLKLYNKNIKFVSLSRPETIAAFQQAGLFLFPSHLECSPLVLFESMASKTPFLVTDVGNAREIIKWSGSGVLLPTIMSAKEQGYCRPKIKESAKILNNLSKDRTTRKKMSDSGFHAWLENFTWEHIADQYEEAYFTVVKKAI